MARDAADDGGPVTLDTAQAGSVLLDDALVVSEAQGAAYRAVVADLPLYRELRIVPGMAVAALALARVMDAVHLPAGAVHTAQDLAFAAPVAAGVPLRVRATLAQNSVRMGARFAVLDVTVEAAGVHVLRGRTTLSVPVAQTAARARP